jgi:5'-3' exonuclease
MNPKRPRIYLIDGSSYIFRAFFALPPLKNSSGLPTQAIYGFTSMTLKFLRQIKPEYIAVLLDAGRETFRNELYEDYKGNRPEAPPDLIPQFPYIRKVLVGLNMAVVETPGYEADDLIATMCKMFAAEADEVVIVSGDKDLMQLVGRNVVMLDTTKDKRIGVDEVRQKFGVEPDRVVEVVGLMGDAVDNIPGVKGIGEKTAMTLIQRYRTLENLFANLDDLERSGLKGATRIRKALEQNREAAFLSRELARVRDDVPIEINLAALRYDGPKTEELRALFTELEFTKLIQELEVKNAS